MEELINGGFGLVAARDAVLLDTEENVQLKDDAEMCIKH